MKEIFTISTGVDVAKTKPNVKSSKEILSGEDKTSSKDFLSIMFAQIKESIKISEEDSKLSLKLDSSLEDTKVELSTKGEQKSLDNHLLEDLLKVISLLKNPDAKISSFPSLSNKLTKLINSETALKELKDVSNITDLLKLSKKYDLGLEKISVKKMDLDTLKKEFPVLAKKEFFVEPKEIDAKVIVDSKKEVETKPTVLSITNIEKPKTEIKKEPTLFEKIMSSPKEDKKEATVQVAKEIVKEKIVEDKKETTIQVVKEIVKEKIVEDKKETIAIRTSEEVKKTIKVVQEETPKVIVKEEQKELKTKTTKEDLHVKEGLHVKVDDEVKKQEVTRVTETKIESNIPKKGMIESILQGIKTDKQVGTKTATMMATENANIDTKATENSELKTEPIANRNELKPQIKTDTLASKQLSPSKDTFNNFAADFKEKLENYKPPFMRVQLALNPKGLGEVDVVIVNRGNNLHVNISSNTNTMSLFTQNQAEFKNSLVNMGFTNLEMNFSEQKENKEQQQNNKASKELDETFEDENIEEETTSIELVVPQYV